MDTSWSIINTDVACHGIPHTLLLTSSLATILLIVYMFIGVHMKNWCAESVKVLMDFTVQSI